MTTKRSLSRIATLLCFCLIFSTAAYASLESAWTSLLKNNLPQAHSEFLSSMDAQKSEEALQGLLLTAWASGDSQGVAKALSWLAAGYPDSPYTPAYLALWGGSSLHGWKALDRARALDEALNESSSVPHQQALAYELTETLDMLLDDRVEDAARRAGLLLDGWSTIGPFGRYGAADLFQPFGPETGFRQRYSGWKETVEYQPVERPDKTGLVELSALVQPDTGIAYALNAVESKQETEAWLTVYSPADFQVWWNGKPVAEKAHYLLHTADSRTVSVPVRQGKNLLVVKSQKTNQAWWVRAALQAKGSNALDVSSVPFNYEDFSPLYLTPFEIAHPRADETPVEESPYPFDLPQPNEPVAQVVNNILLSAWHLDRGEFETARRLLTYINQTHPEFAFPYSLYGDESLRLSEQRPGSKARFHQEAETALRRALELDPKCRSALIGLVTYFLDRDQTDQALDCLNEHLGKYPDIFDEGSSNLIAYSYGILYSKKNFDAEAAQYYRKALNGWTASYEIYRLLFDYYSRNNEFENAKKIVLQALNEFPAYLPFLDRAGQLEEDDEAITCALDVLERAARIHPDRLQYSLQLGEILEKSGRAEKALDLYNELLTRYPIHPRLLERKAALDYLNANEEEALAAYEKAYKIAPRRMRPFRALRDAAGRADLPYQQYDVQLDDIDLSLADRWNDSRASVIYLLDIMVLDMHEDGSYDQYIHQALKIMNQEGMRKWAEVVIPKGGNVEIVSARTIAPDGTTWDVSNIQDLSGQQSLSMYGIEPGVVLEYAFIDRTGRSEPGVNFSGGGYFFGSDDDPMVVSKLTVVKPEGGPFHLANHPHDFQPEISREDGKEIYVWEKRMSEGLKPERYSPPLGQRVPSVQWSTCPDWGPFVERQRMSVWGYEEPSVEIDRLVQKFQSETQNKRDYIEKAYDFARTQIEESNGGFTTADTVALGVGGKFQKMRLVRQLLRKAGIEVHIALAVDNDANDGYRPIPVLNYPGSLFLTIPRQDGLGERIVLDFSSRFTPMGDIDPVMRKQIALVVDATAPYFEPLDPSLWESGLIDRRFRLKLQEDGSASVTGGYLYDNMYDRQIREALTNPEIKQRLADSQLAGDLRGIQVDKSEILDIEDIHVPPRLVFEGTLPDVAKPSGAGELKISPVTVRVNASGLVGEPTRAFRMEFRNSLQWNPLDIRFDLSYYLDRGDTIVLPENVTLISEFGYYSLFYEWDGPELIVRRSFVIPAQEIEPETYERFVDFCRTIDQIEDRDVAIREKR